jgi:hypothetical protein
VPILVHPEVLPHVEEAFQVMPGQWKNVQK